MVSSSSQAGSVPGDELGGKKERDREKQKGRKMLGTLLTPSLSQLFTPQRLFLEGKGLTNSFFPPRSAATHPAHFLDVS